MRRKMDIYNKILKFMAKLPKQLSRIKLREIIEQKYFDYFLLEFAKAKQKKDKNETGPLTTEL